MTNQPSGSVLGQTILGALKSLGDGPKVEAVRSREGLDFFASLGQKVAQVGWLRAANLYCPHLFRKLALKKILGKQSLRVLHTARISSFSSAVRFFAGSSGSSSTSASTTPTEV